MARKFLVVLVSCCALFATGGVATAADRLEALL